MRSLSRMRLEATALFVAILWSCSPSSAAEVAAIAPHVAGYDRFGIHHEIDEQAAGRLLITELSCTACHHDDRPELVAKRGPRLHAAGLTLNAEWMHQYLMDPHASKPGTTMPDVLGTLDDVDRDLVVQALVAFLQSQRQPFPEIRASGINPVPFEFWRRGDAGRGKQLYHNIGCVACHQPDESVEAKSKNSSAIDRLIDDLDPEELAEMGLESAARKVQSIPLGEIARKYSQRSLTMFLYDPLRTRPAGRMPHFGLLTVEATDVAAYLLSRFADETLEPASSGAVPAQSLVDQGRQHFLSLGCAQCHDADGVDSTLVAKSLTRIDLKSRSGCLASDSDSKVEYQLDQGQVHAISAAIDASEDLGDDLQHQMLVHNCYACHDRDSRGGVGRERKVHFEMVGGVDLGDEGRLPPPLSNVGRKLQKPWMSKVLSGTAPRVRPHMHIRMPKFPTQVSKSLPGQFAKADQVDSHPATDVFAEAMNSHSKEKLADAGRSAVIPCRESLALIWVVWNHVCILLGFVSF